MKTNLIKSRIKPSHDFFSVKTTSPQRSLINVQYLLDISGGNTSFIHAVLQAFRDESISFLQQMENGLASHDFLAIKKITHKIKPAGAYIGADSFTLLLANLEQAVERTNAEEATAAYHGIKSLLKRIFTEIDGYVTTTSSLV